MFYKKDIIYNKRLYIVLSLCLVPRCWWFSEDVWPAAPGALNHNLWGPSTYPTLASGLEQTGSQLPLHCGYGCLWGVYPFPILLYCFRIIFSGAAGNFMGLQERESKCVTCCHLFHTPFLFLIFYCVHVRWSSWTCECRVPQWHDSTTTGPVSMVLPGRLTHLFTSVLQVSQQWVTS